MRSVLPLVALSTEVPVGQRAGIDAEEGELTDERVGHDLERERRERLLVVGLALDDGAFLASSVRSMPVTGGMSSGDGR